MTRRSKPIAKLVLVGLETSQLHIADAHGWLEEGNTFFEAIEGIVADRIIHISRVLAKKSRTN